MELPTSSCHGVLSPRYYGLVGTSSRELPGGSRRVVLLSPRVWKGCQWVGTGDWYLMHYSTPSVTGGQKHTHTIMYARVVVDFGPQKLDPHRIQITAGGNLIKYPGELTTKTADLTTSKLMWNSILSSEGAKFMCLDIKNFT